MKQNTEKQIRTLAQFQEIDNACYMGCWEDAAKLYKTHFNSVLCFVEFMDDDAAEQCCITYLDLAYLVESAAKLETAEIEQEWLEREQEYREEIALQYSIETLEREETK